MANLSELRLSWRPLLAAMIGLATGNSILGMITSAIAPTLLADTGWSKADFALLGSVSLLGALVLPAVGRLADVFGVRIAASIGLICNPLVYFGYSLTNGSLGAFVAIYLFQTTVCVTTTAMIYTRLIVQNVQHSRGLALAIVASSPAVLSALAGPLLSDFVEHNGWRFTYRMLAVVFACTGVLTFLLLPADRPARRYASAAGGGLGRVYRGILADPAFQLLGGAMLLCNLPQALLLSQLKLLVIDQGITGTQAGMMFLVLSAGMLAGRICTGVALDRFAPHLVAFLAMGVPGIGLFIIASPLDSPEIVALSVFFLGFAYGAEGDAVAYLVARHFGLEVYSSIMGLLTALMAFSSAAGAVILSATLGASNSYVPFLIGAGAAVIAGSALLLGLGRLAVQAHSHQGSTPTRG